MQLELFSEVPVTVQIHVISAGTALIIGLVLFALPKGPRLHRIMGITCAILLSLTVITAAFIPAFDFNRWSILHIFIPMATFGLLGLSRGPWKKKWKTHGNAGRGLIFGALLIPGIFALAAPGRLLNTMFFG